MDSWVGIIKMINYKLWLSTPDGSRCIVKEPDAVGLEHFEEKRENVRQKEKKKNKKRLIII